MGYLVFSAAKQTGIESQKIIPEVHVPLGSLLGQRDPRPFDAPPLCVLDMRTLMV